MRPPTKVLAAVLLLVAGTGIAFAGSSPDEHRTVTDVVTDPRLGPGDEVHVKATVAEDSLDRNATPTTFLLEDPRNQLRVRYDDPIPLERVDGTLGGRTAVVAGLLDRADGQLVLDGTNLELGCASKYRSE